MTAATADQLAALKRIASFSAKIRGHELGTWHSAENFAQASCIRCGAALRVYFPSLQPEMEGTALERTCESQAAAGRAA